MMWQNRLYRIWIIVLTLGINITSVLISLGLSYEQPLSGSAEGPSLAAPEVSEPGDTRRGFGASFGAQPDPLQQLIDLAKSAAARLKQQDAGETTRAIQRRIVEEFDRLLGSESPNQQASRPQSGDTSPRESEPANNETAQATQPRGETSETGGRQATAQGTNSGSDWRRLAGEIWGQLPPRERPPVAERAFEAIIPKYRSLVEAYYRELAKRRASSGVEAVTPGTNRN